MAFLEGYLIGLTLIVFIGPVFFTLLKSALQYGFRSGFAVALGIFISDVAAVVLCLAGVAKIVQQPQYKLYIGIASAAILVGLGLRYVFKHASSAESRVEVSRSSYAALFTKGFLVNFVNPFVFGIWIGIISLATHQYGEGNERLVYLGAVLLGILSTDTLKAAFAHRLQPLLRPNLLRNIYRIIGLVLIGFGVYVLVAVLPT